MKKPGRLLILMAVLALAFFLFALLGHGSRTKRILREYKAELRARGEKLTYAELKSSYANNLDRFLPAFTNATGRLRQVPLQPGLLELRHFVAPGTARVLWSASSPANTISWDEFRSELALNQRSLDEIREALKATPADSGSRTGLAKMPVFRILSSSRNAAHWLSAEIIADLHDHNLQAALQNLVALTSLAQFNRDEYTLGSQMIRVAIARLGLMATWEALQAPGWTDAELAQLQRSWEALDLVEAVEKGFLGERAFAVELWSMIRNTRSSQIRTAVFNWPSHEASLDDLLDDYVVFPAHRMTSFDDDELFHLRSMQQSLVSIRLIKSHRPWNEARRGLDNTLIEITRIANSPAWFRYYFSLLSIPNLPKPGNVGVRAETERQMTIAAIAIARHKLRYGRPPMELSALLPEFVSSVPFDCMSGNAIGYRLKDDRTFVLYSVGEDGNDDGGDPQSASRGKFDLWDGKDAVWPAAAGSGKR